MEIGRVVIFGLIVVSAMIFAASATSGTATFYTDYSSSACYGGKKEGTMIAAANHKLYNKGKACGTRYKVRCTGATNSGLKPCRKGEVIVKIVDLCDGCAHDQLDLSRQAFSKIANPDAGKIRIKFTKV